MKFSVGAEETTSIIIRESGDYEVTLTGEGAHVDILGAFHLKGSEKLEINVVTIHAARHTSADTLIKCIADDKATATINGTIIVEKDAQQTNSFLTENVLLLSEKAQAHAIPNLEIEADDVKCSHAATVGTLDEEHLFYLMSRGISRDEAKKMIADGFLAQVQERIDALS